MPLTVQEPRGTVVKFISIDRWSVMCLVAPESANQSAKLRARKQDDDM